MRIDYGNALEACMEVVIVLEEPTTTGRVFTDCVHK